ncbi:L-threonylcarbamoyladenylate synthase [Maritalea sp.]|uniref:L-threonylcarbamoyladenylate synthase n=1 Tax=Maritalea sp. TaxID=2003361 RepID=UPI003EFAE789
MKQRHLYRIPVSVNEAVEHLNNESVVAIPTETVYGLAGLSASDDAVLKIFETKGRPRFNPLIVHCADLAMAQEIAQFSELAKKVADAFWPGPLTLVLPKRDDAKISDLVTAGLETVAVRLPRHPLAKELLRKLGQPVAAPSANPSGKLSPTAAEHVINAFDGAVPVVEGGACETGLESTILAISNEQLTLLRPGSITDEMITAALGVTVYFASDAKILAPGMLKSHYAPNASVRLNVTTPQPGEAYLAFGATNASGPTVLNLSAVGDLDEAAKNLFGHLRKLDASDVQTIAVAPIPEIGIGLAINDRLKRASADRSS